MSKVISFRLNPENPREARALEILRTKTADGFSLRRVLTDALIGIEANNGQNGSASPYELNLAIEHVSRLLEYLKSGNKTQNQPTHPRSGALNDHFLSSVKAAIKPGIKSD